MITAGDFILNSRVCKLVLSATPAQQADFIARLPVAALADLVAGMECNGYAIMNTYRAAYREMASALAARTPREAR